MDGYLTKLGFHRKVNDIIIIIIEPLWCTHVYMQAHVNYNYDDDYGPGGRNKLLLMIIMVTKQEYQTNLQSYLLVHE